MEITPSQVTAATFHTVRKGYDPDEVDAFLSKVARALEECQQQATAMEARARAAVARLQEMQSAADNDATQPITLTQQAPDPDAEPDDVRVSADEAGTISRTLLLAQRTADTTVAEAAAEAERIKAEAQDEAEATIDSTREMSAKILEEARAEARRSTDAERRAAENEVQSLVARREFLIGDVDQLEQFLVDQRERLRGAARQIEALCDRVPGGLGTVRPPAMSASDDDALDETGELVVPVAAAGPFVTADELARALEASDTELGIGDDSISASDGIQSAGIDDDAEGAGELPIRGENWASD